MLSRAVAWGCLLMLAIASWTPGNDMVRTGAGGLSEHLVAYLLTGVVFAWGFPERRLVFIAALLSSYAGFLEMGQTWAPGRHPSILDWVAGTCGASLGVLSVAVIRAMKDRSKRSNSRL